MIVLYSPLRCLLCFPLHWVSQEIQGTSEHRQSFFVFLRFSTICDNHVSAPTFDRSRSHCSEEKELRCISLSISEPWSCKVCWLFLNMVSWIVQHLWEKSLRMLNEVRKRNSNPPFLPYSLLHLANQICLHCLLLVPDQVRKATEDWTEDFQFIIDTNEENGLEECHTDPVSFEITYLSMFTLNQS